MIMRGSILSHLGPFRQAGPGCAPDRVRHQWPVRPLLATVWLGVLPVGAHAQTGDGFAGTDNGPAPIPVCISASWSNAACWTVAGTNPAVHRPPEDGENASVIIGQSVTLDTSSANLATLIVSAGPGSTGTFLQPGSTMTATNELIGPWGSYVQSGGVNNVASTVSVTATYNLQGGALSATGVFIAPTPPLGTLPATAGTFTQTGGTNTVVGLTVDSLAAGTSSGTYTLQGGTLSAQYLTAGFDLNGTFNQSGGTNDVSNALVLGSSEGAVGTFNLCNAVPSCAATLSGKTVVIGDAGSGTFSQGGGTVTVSGSLNLGVQISGSGTYSLGGGSLTALQEFIGVNGGGTGTLEQSDGTNTVTSETGSLFVENGGTYKLNGGTLTAAVETVGYQSGGSLVQSGGQNETSSAPSELYVGVDASEGKYSLQGGQLGATEPGAQLTEYIGFNGGSGTLSQSGGNNYAYNIGIGEKNGSEGTYTLSGPGSFLAATWLTIGSSGGTGVFNQSGGTAITQNPLTLGENGSGTYNLTDGLLKSAGEYVGVSGLGVFDQTGGINNVGQLAVGARQSGLEAAVATGTYDLSGGTLMAQGENLGNGDLGIGTFSQTGGSNTVDFLEVGSNGTYNFSGGTLTYTQLVVVADGRFNSLGDPVMTGGTFTNNGTVSASGGSLTVRGDFINNGAYLSSGERNTFTGLTVGSAGYLQAAAGDVFTVDGNFTNNSTQDKLWQTGSAELEFAGGGTHLLSLAGVSGSGFTNNFAWGTLDIASGNAVQLTAGSGHALYVESLEGLTFSGRTITDLDGSAGLVIYYNSADNPLLNGNYALIDGGELMAAGHSGTSGVPEPCTLPLIAEGFGMLVVLGLYRGRSGTRRSVS
jgi:hypothetical protein